MVDFLKRIPQVVSRRLLLNIFIYFLAGWLSLAMIGYGVSLLQISRKPDLTRMEVKRDTVREVRSLTQGRFSDVCVVLAQDQGEWCVTKDVIRPGAPIQNVYPHLQPGTDVLIKGFNGLVGEMIVRRGAPDQIILVEYGYGMDIVKQKLTHTRGYGGFLWVILGVLFIPLLVLFRKKGLPRLLSRVRGGGG